ncbi:MAG: RDD family protein [Sandaracinus sp.]
MGVPEHVLASAGQRFAGRFIDNLIFLAPLFAAVFGIVGLPREIGPAGGIGAGLLGLAGYIGLQWYQLGPGQTVGKRLAGSRVVDLEGEPVGRLRACYGRDLLIFFLNATRIFGILNALFVFQRSKRCGHDYAFGTVVVDVAAFEAHRRESQGERLADVFR